MTESVVSVKPTATISQVAGILQENRIHRILVVEDDVLLGIVSSFDLLGSLEDARAVAQVA